MISAVQTTPLPGEIDAIILTYAVVNYRLARRLETTEKELYEAGLKITALDEKVCYLTNALNHEETKEEVFMDLNKRLGEEILQMRERLNDLGIYWELPAEIASTLR